MIISVSLRIDIIEMSNSARKQRQMGDWICRFWRAYKLLVIIFVGRVFGT
jgi:hypothetical protein